MPSATSAINSQQSLKNVSSYCKDHFNTSEISEAKGAEKAKIPTEDTGDGKERHFQHIHKIHIDTSTDFSLPYRNKIRLYSIHS